MRRRLAALSRSRLWKEYRALRRKESGWGRSASNCLHMARHTLARPPLPFKGATRVQDSSTLLPCFAGRLDGFDVMLRVESDDAGVCNCSWDRASGAFEVEPYGTFWADRDAPGPRLGDLRFLPPRDFASDWRQDRCIVFRPGEDYGHSYADLIGYARDAGMAKGPAHAEVMAEIARLRDRAIALAIGEAPVVGVVATVSRAGVELAEASCWGIELADSRDDYAYADVGADVTREALHDARDRLKALCHPADKGRKGRAKSRA